MAQKAKLRSSRCPQCEALEAELRRDGFTRADHPNRQHSISACVIRGFSAGEPLVAIDGNHPPKDQINVVVDGLHWLQGIEGRPDRLRVVLHRPDPEAAEAARTLVRVINGGQTALTVGLEGGDSARAKEGLRDWTTELSSLLAAGPPELVNELRQRVGNDFPSFRWYPNLTQRYWSGRIEGLEVIRVSRDGLRGRLRMGSGGSPSPGSAVAAFRGVIGGTEGYDFGDSHGRLPRARVTEIADLLRRLAAARESGPLREFYPEHRLESRILRGDVRVRADGQPLEPVGDVGQFPTVWSTAGRPRYLDALMRGSGSRVPWAVEIKVAPGSGLPRYYRHGIPQALLYREYVRAVPAVAEFFDAELDLDAPRCEAALAVPEDSGPAFESARLGLERLADLFSVHLVTVKA